MFIPIRSGPSKSDNINRMIQLTVIQFSGGYCNVIRVSLIQLYTLLLPKVVKNAFIWIIQPSIQFLCISFISTYNVFRYISCMHNVREWWLIFLVSIDIIFRLNCWQPSWLPFGLTTNLKIFSTLGFLVRPLKRKNFRDKKIFIEHYQGT